ncbi:hypothetical protein ABT160_45830 [Streptomyces sp. NPDC001941]|uniref:hypothetical protein n=1 Tax=Streptomyces sp. NPDC001941 TaxID=3154659 RepID=UPI0033166270
MKKVLRFDTETDAYDDVLAQLKAAYGERTWSKSDVELWLSLLTEEQVSFLRLLAQSSRRTLRAEDVKRSLGYSTENKRCLARINLGISRAARSGPGHCTPVEFSQSSTLYSLDPPVAKLVLDCLTLRD